MDIMTTEEYEQLKPYLADDVRLLGNEDRRLFVSTRRRMAIRCRGQEVRDLAADLRQGRAIAESGRALLASLQEQGLWKAGGDSAVPESWLRYHVDLNVTQRCNLSCWFCCADSKAESAPELWDPARLLAVVDAVLAKVKLHSLRITGGEPFLREDLLRLIRRVRSIHDGPLVIATNGTRIGDETVCRELAELNCAVDVSLDGHCAAVCDAMRGAGVFDAAVGAIQRLQKAGVSEIVVSCIATRENYPRYREQFRSLCRELGVGGHVFRTLIPRGRAAKNFARYRQLVVPRPSKSELVLRQLRARLSCGAIKRQIYVLGNGDVYPCQSLRLDRMRLGNALDPDWSVETTSNPVARQVQQWTVDTAETCSSCNVRYFCANGCFARNLETGGVLCARRSDCTQVKQALEKIVWG